MDTNSTSPSLPAFNTPLDQDGYPVYDPSASIPKWHQNMELATICITNGLSRKTRAFVSKSDTIY